MKTDLSIYRGDKSLLEAELHRAGSQKAKQKDMWTCCLHNEKTGSLHLVELDGVWRFHCFGCDAGGDLFDFMALTQKKPVDEIIAEFIKTHERRFLHPSKPQNAPIALETQIKANPGEKPAHIFSDILALTKAVEFGFARDGMKLEAKYEYTAPKTGRVELIVYRLNDGKNKKFIQATPAEVGGYQMRNRLPKNPIYNRTRVAAKENVVIVEGEKKVHCLAELDIVATCSPGGANNADKADWTPLAGKAITIWPDNDESGHKYCEMVLRMIEQLEPAPTTIRIVNIAELGLEKAGDVVDFVARYDSPEKRFDAVVSVLSSARSTGVLSSFETMMQDARSRKRVSIPWPWPMLTEMANALIPGTFTALCGSPGATKSLLILQMLRYLVECNVPCSLYAFEDGVEHQLRRATAQICKNSYFTNDKWCAENPEISIQNERDARPEIERLARVIESPKTREELTATALIEWCERKAASGRRVIILDPITLMSRGKNGFQDDESFIDGAKRVAERYGSSILIVTHPRKMGQNPGKFTMDEFSGGAAYSRFAQCLLYLQAHKEKEDVIDTGHGFVTYRFNRTLGIMKARNSNGVGENLAFRFDNQSLTLEEGGKLIDGK